MKTFSNTRENLLLVSLALLLSVILASPVLRNRFTEVFFSTSDYQSRVPVATNLELKLEEEQNNKQEEEERKQILMEEQKKKQEKEQKQKLIEEQKKKQEEERKIKLEQEEQKQKIIEEQKRKKEEEKKKKQEEEQKQKLIEEQKRKQEEEQKKKQEEEQKQKLIEEQKRKQEEEQKKKQEEEQKQKLIEEQKRKQEEEQKKKQEEEQKQKLIEEQKRKQEEEQKRKQKEEQKRKQEEEQKQKLIEEQKRKQEEEQKQKLVEEQKKKKEEEEKLNNKLTSIEPSVTPMPIDEKTKFDELRTLYQKTEEDLKISKNEFYLEKMSIEMNLPLNAKLSMIDGEKKVTPINNTYWVSHKSPANFSFSIEENKKGWRWSQSTHLDKTVISGIVFYSIPNMTCSIKKFMVYIKQRSNEGFMSIPFELKKNFQNDQILEFPTKLHANEFTIIVYENWGDSNCTCLFKYQVLGGYVDQK